MLLQNVETTSNYRIICVCVLPSGCEVNYEYYTYSYVIIIMNIIFASVEANCI
jgi:hypothetical protein